jgi:hypothetical protein
VTYEQLLNVAPGTSQIGDVSAAKEYSETLSAALQDADAFTASQRVYLYRLRTKWDKRAAGDASWQVPGRPIKETTRKESQSIAAKSMRRHERENESPLLATIMQKFGTPRVDEFRYLKFPKAKP